MVKSLPANAGDMGSIPDLGRSHMLCGATKLLCATTFGPVCRGARAPRDQAPPQEKPPQGEASLGRSSVLSVK